MTEKNREKFSFKVNVGHVSTNPVTVCLEAEPDERKALAERWGVDRVDAVRAELALSRWKRDGVRIKGHVEADIVQHCVVSLEPVADRVEERFEALFVPEGSKLARIATDDSGEMVIEAEGPDLPETFSGDSIDVGAVCEEFVVLAINPYPRKEGVVLDSPEETDDQDNKAPSPFAGLQGLKVDKHGE